MPHPLRRVVPTLCAVALLAAASFGQCTVAEAPAVRGLTLGMSRKAFMEFFPGTKPINMFNREELSRVRGFAGLELLVFRINNDNLKLDQLELRYAGLSGGLDRLTLRITKELKLPHDAWKPVDADKAEMQCLTFRVEADAKNNGFTITDIEGQKYWDAMRQKAERRGQ